MTLSNQNVTSSNIRLNRKSLVTDENTYKTFNSKCGYLTPGTSFH